MIRDEHGEYSQRCCTKGTIWNVLVPSQASPIYEVISVQYITQIHIFWNIGHPVQMLVCRVAKEWLIHFLKKYRSFAGLCETV